MLFRMATQIEAAGIRRHGRGTAEQAKTSGGHFLDPIVILELIAVWLDVVVTVD